MSWIFLLITTLQAQSPFFEDLENLKTRSLLLKTQQANLQSAKDNLFSKNMFWTPTLSASVGRLRTDLSEYDYMKGSATWNLFKGGGDLNARSAASLTHQAQEYKISDSQLKLEVQAADLVFHQLYLQDVLQSTQELVRLREESHRIVLEKYKQGKMPLQEVMKSEVDRNQQTTRLRNLQIEQLENQANLKSLLLDDLRTKKWPFASTQPILAIQALPPEPSPKIKNLSLLSQASMNLWKSAKSSHWPSLDFSYDYQVYPLKDRTNTQMSAALVLSFPLWNQWSTSAEVSSTYASFVTARNQFEEAERTENNQRAILFQKIELARQNLKDASTNLDQSTRLYKDMLTSFRYGRISTNELLIEQNRLIDSELGLSRSQWDFHKILIEGCSLIGSPARSCLLQ